MSGSGWSPDFTPFTDLLQSDGSQAPPQDDSSPIHRRSDVGASPQPRTLFPAAPPAPAPFQYPYGPYPYPPPPYAPRTGTGSEILPPYPPPTLAPYPYYPPPYAPRTGTGSETQPPYPPPTLAPYPYPPPPYAPYAPYPPPPAPPSSVSVESQNEGAGRTGQNRPKRLDWSIAEEEKLVHAWLLHSNDSIAGKSKTGTTFWGQIAATFNSTSEPSRHRTAKQLKDHWNVYNREVTMFNGYYIQEERLRQSGADDAMVMEAAMARYENDIRVTAPFKRHHWWQAVRHEPKWTAKYLSGSESDCTAKRTRLGVSGDYSSGGTEDTEEEVRPIGRDRAKAMARREKGKAKGKEKESSSSSEVRSKAFGMKNMWGGLVKAKLVKQWNILKSRSTTDMDETEKRSHMKVVKMVEKELGLDEDEDED